VETWSQYKTAEDDSARERLILECLPLVKFVVGKLALHLPTHLDREDLIESGIFGLIDAIDKFNPEKEVKFETYAILRIRGAVLDELRSRDWVPRSLRRKARTVRQVRQTLESEKDGNVPTEILSDALGVTEEELDQLLSEVSFVSFVSLYETRGDRRDSDGARVVDWVADARTQPPEHPLQFEEKKRILTRGIAELPDQERLIVTLYYYENMLLKDIGKVLGVTESRVSQVLSRALLSLRLKMNQA